MNALTIRRPDDFHVHLRQGDLLARLARRTSRQFARALVMPNTDPPVLDARDIAAYRERILREDPGFQPLMTVYLTEDTTPQMIRDAKAAGAVAAKLYPRGATTGSGHGVRIDRRDALDPVFETMRECGMVLCLHAEHPDREVLQRESYFQFVLPPLVEKFPELKIVVEHVTTASLCQAVWNDLPASVAATITVHHLLLTLDDVVGDLLRPHHFCKPIAKQAHDREVLRQAATSGNPKFFLGTDSAPHPIEKKECDGGCAGIYSAPVAMPLLATAFGELDALDKLEDFASRFGAEFYGLPLNQGTLTLKYADWEVPQTCDGLVPFCAGQTLPWRLAR